jgi:hypothetical protein
VIAAMSLPPADAALAYFQTNTRGQGGRTEALDAERRERLRRRVDEAVTIAAIGSEAEKAIRVLLPNATPETFDFVLPTGEPPGILDAVRAWLMKAAGLPPARRAAALLVADQVLQGTQHAFKLTVADGPGEPQARAAREAATKLGAHFNHVQLGGVWVYANDWLREAWEVDPSGRAGELAFLTLLDKGFETSGMCGDQQGEGFSAVIEQGEAYLRSARGAKSPNRVDVLFALARANSDLLALASGMGYEGPGGSEQVKFKDAGPRGRQAALRNYRAALALENDTRRAADARTEVWRLAANLAPSRTYFYCVYD